ncbi:hypothetical protein HCH29_08885 [Enterococcus gilvus]|nr:hypothetical protein [Enterococcus gilvus]
MPNKKMSLEATLRIMTLIQSGSIRMNRPLNQRKNDQGITHSFDPKKIILWIF